jgi:hypothetical protein
MTPGICRHCLQFKDLCDSHAIPDAVFRRLFKLPGGAITLVGDETTPNGYSTDSWKWPILCETCEADFEKRFDGYGVSVLLSKIGKFEPVDGGVRVSGVDQARLTQFFVSVAWRAALSGHAEYSRLNVLNEEHLRVLHDGIAEHGRPPYVAMRRLVDDAGEISRQEMREVVVAPTVYTGDGMVTIFFVFSGFLIAIFVTRPPLKMRQKISLLKPRSRAAPFFVRDCSFEKFKPLLNVMMMSMQKEEQGITRIRKPISGANRGSERTHGGG